LIHTAQALVDYLVNVPALPKRGRNIVATDHALYAGGAVTVLTAAAYSGAGCVLAGSVGTGPYATLVRSALAEAGVTVSSPAIKDMDTGVCLVFIEPTAERTFITIQGAERVISEQSLSAADPQPGDIVAVSGYTLQGVTGAPLLAWLASLPHGVEVMLDPGAAFSELDDATQEAALELTTMWTSNAEEAASLVGDGDMMESPAKIAARLPIGTIVIVRDGPAGCAVYQNGYTTKVPGFPQKPIDTNGAGDTHTGVMAAEILAGTNLITAAQRANAAGALKVTHHGLGRTPRRADISAFLALNDAGEGR